MKQMKGTYLNSHLQYYDFNTIHILEAVKTCMAGLGAKG
jgi:hypothetical protein